MMKPPVKNKMSDGFKIVECDDDCGWRDGSGDKALATQMCGLGWNLKHPHERQVVCLQSQHSRGEDRGSQGQAS